MCQHDPMIGAILAGGRSSRMGHDKAFVEVADRTMLDWVADALTESCGQVVVAGRVSSATSLVTVPDPDIGYRGPLAGLVGVMRAYPGSGVVLVAVDQPWVRSDTVRRLGATAADLAMVPVEGGVRQTTCAVYPASLAPAAESELAGGGSLQSLLDIVAFHPVTEWHAWGEDGRSWYSADTPESIDHALAHFGPPPG